MYELGLFKDCPRRDDWSSLCLFAFLIYSFLSFRPLLVPSISAYIQGIKTLPIKYAFMPDRLLFYLKGGCGLFHFSAFSTRFTYVTLVGLEG
uniref:Uncharacterized protein n=1 Tax=Utricularia reniformis TaxID=192314 RepID=A0A1Y0AZ55_9LAMI|nr:hypothetical protein AEK19_MT1947 [Utricularia reniformis]ART30419.1 hypothetical protein AEK19_MT1947 [Utricularia reniformis]